MLCCVYVYFDYVVIGSRYFFFFKQKTAYEMRISDWSSDVCSSDLLALADAFGEFDEDLAAVVKSVKRPPGCTISIDRVTEIDVCEVDASGNRARRLGISILLSQRGELVLRILPGNGRHIGRSEEHTSELQSLMRISYAVFCLKKKKIVSTLTNTHP